MIFELYGQKLEVDGYDLRDCEDKIKRSFGWDDKQLKKALIKSELPVTKEDKHGGGIPRRHMDLIVDLPFKDVK